VCKTAGGVDTERKGLPMPVGVYVRKKRPIAERFWPNIICDLNSRCWLWTGSVFANGYGSFHLNGHTEYTHRVSWLIHHGEMPDGWVLHRCDTPRCVRPDHLFLGDHEANMADMVTKGRSRRGERTNLAKLTEQQVIGLLARHKAGESRTSLATKYGLDYSTICYIVRGDSWAHLQ